MSTSNQLVVHFKSNDAITKYGFLALYVRIGGKSKFREISPCISYIQALFSHRNNISVPIFTSFHEERDRDKLYNLLLYFYTRTKNNNNNNDDDDDNNTKTNNNNNNNNNNNINNNNNNTKTHYNNNNNDIKTHNNNDDDNDSETNINNGRNNSGYVMVITGLFLVNIPLLIGSLCYFWC